MSNASYRRVVEARRASNRASVRKTAASKFMEAGEDAFIYSPHDSSIRKAVMPGTSAQSGRAYETWTGHTIYDYTVDGFDGEFQLGGEWFPVSAKSSRRAVRRVTGRFVPAGEVRVGDEVNIGTLSDIPDEDAYFTVTKVKRQDDMVYVWVDIIDPASEDEDVYYVVPQGTEVEVTSDHLARRNASWKMAAGWKSRKDLGYTYKVIRRAGDPYGGVELTVDYTEDDGSYWWYVHDLSTNSAYALESGTASSVQEAKRAAESAAKELYRSASRKRAEMEMRAFKGIAIYPDKRVEEVTISTLEQMQSIVKGLIQPVTLSDGSTMYVNEEGLYLFGPEDFNSIATDVAGVGGAQQILLSGVLGPALLVGPVDDEGDHMDLTPQARSWVNRVAREASVKRRAPRRRYS